MGDLSLAKPIDLRLILSSISRLEVVVVAAELIGCLVIGKTKLIRISYLNLPFR